MARTVVRLLALAAFATTLAACGGGGGNTPAPGGGSSAGTRSLTLDWDANTEPDLAGYKVYRSTVSGSYQTAAIADLPAGTTTYTVNGLQSGTTYYFVVTAYNTSLNESLRSNEVSKAL